MDPATADYYSTNAQGVAQLYESGTSTVTRYVGAAFPQGSRVLDVGAGSGRDLAALMALGYDGYGVEPAEGLLMEALRHHPELAGRMVRGALPELGEPFGGKFDGILCSAVLMHVPEGDLFDTAFALRHLLRPHGRLLVSLPLSRSDVGADERHADGRLFKTYAPDYLQLLFERIGFQQIGRWDTEDALGRAGMSWYTQLFELRVGGAARAVDQIEGILNRDRKEATYKLALFRAMAELATQEPHGARWYADQTVGVPLRRVAEKWLGYYWPIFASARFIPQSQAEGAGPTRPLKFRASLSALMASYASAGEHGGLSAWQLDLSSDRLSPSVQAQMQATLRVIAAAIRDGPVTFSGGALDSGTVFTYAPSTGDIRMGADLWREFSLLGHWIVDAVILRWAELSERFGYRLGIRSGDVLPLLLAKAEPERATSVARQIFLSHGVERCTWSDRRLTDRFVVDHVIPFSLWGSNDLWNLLPVHPAVNGNKSDKLPTAELLRARRSLIVGGWHLLRNEIPAAFEQQASHLLGRPLSGPLGWEDDLFARLREAIELTALQRGVQRWAPGVQPAITVEGLN